MPSEHHVSKSTLRVLLLMPSFYGLAMFSIAYVAYALNTGYYEQTSPELHLVCISVLLAFALSTVRFYPSFAQCAAEISKSDPQQQDGHWSFIVLLHFVGLAGIGEYLRTLVTYFGSAVEIGLRLTASSGDVRNAALDVTSIGTQLSYFGWIAIWFTALYPPQRPAYRFLLWLSIIQFIANLLYVDRTRPIWILFVCALLLGYKHFKKLNTRRLLLVTASSLTAILTLFVSIGAWIGKVDLSSVLSDGPKNAGMALEPVYFYLTSGFAYLNRILITEQPDFTLARSLYPLWTIASRFELVDLAPPQINDFLQIPNLTNVGTFLEPMFRDGGVLLMVFGTMLHAFGFNWIGARLLRSRAAFCLMAWAVLCFTDLIAFFTPKYTNTPTWLVVGLGLIWLIRGSNGERRIPRQWRPPSNPGRSSIVSSE